MEVESELLLSLGGFRRLTGRSSIIVPERCKSDSLQCLSKENPRRRKGSLVSSEHREDGKRKI